MRHYLKHQSGIPRPVSGSLDIGGSEFHSSAPVQNGTTSLPNAIRGRGYYKVLQASGGSGGYVWSVSFGTLPAGLILDSTAGLSVDDLDEKRFRPSRSWSKTLKTQEIQQVSRIQ